MIAATIASPIARPLAQGIVVSQGAPVTPDQVPGLLAWYDASDAASFTYNAGTSVQTWADKSGAGNTLTYDAAQSNNRPTRGATDWSASLPGVTFVDGYFAFFVANSKYHCVFAVIKPSNVSGGAYRGVIDWTNWTLLSSTAVNKWGTYGSTGEHNANTALTAGNKYLLEMSGGAGSGIFYRNGSSDGTYADTSFGTSNELRFGALAPSQQYEGVIAEVLLYDPALITDAGRAQIRTYLNSKWAIY